MKRGNDVFKKFGLIVAALSASLILVAPAFAQTAVYQATAPTLANKDRNDLLVDVNGNLRVAVVNGAVATTGTATPADALSNTNVNAARTQGFGMVYNGTTWDRQRGDTNGTVSIPALTATYWNYAAAAGGIVNTTTAVTVKAAAGASIRNYISSMQCSSDALGAATEFAIRDGAAGTVLYRSKFQTVGLPDGREVTFNPPLKGTANTLVEIVTLTASVTGAVYCNLQGFTGS